MASVGHSGSFLCWPARRTITGLLRATARAADRNERPFCTVSKSSKIAWVSGSSASQSNNSGTSISPPPPTTITCENPIPCALAHAISGNSTAPDWETSANRPGPGKTSAKDPLRPQRGTIRPPLAGPSTRKRRKRGRRGASLGKNAASRSPW